MILVDQILHSTLNINFSGMLGFTTSCDIIWHIIYKLIHAFQYIGEGKYKRTNLHPTTQGLFTFAGKARGIFTRKLRQKGRSRNNLEKH